MNKDDWATVDRKGRLVLPPGYAANLGLEPGAQLRAEMVGNQLRLHRPPTHLTKVYIEPTDRCNLDCTFCMHRTYEEISGRMKQATFDRILEGLQGFDPLPTVFFGGLGEPLFHPRLLDWVAQVKALGARAELITNGTLLNENRSRQVIESGLDVLWVSIDGATPESYADVRLGAQLPEVVENMRTLRRMRPGGHHPRPKIGVAFVAMKRNIADLPAVIRLGRSFGAKLFSVSNLVPYTEEMQAETLYNRSMKDIAYFSSIWLPALSLPKMDLLPATRDAFVDTLNSGCSVNLAGSQFSAANDICNFIAAGTTTIAWDGGVSPCWPLMHSHTSYLHGKLHRNRRHVVGNVNTRSLKDLWLDPDYLEYRQKVMGFRFAPCTYCGGCDMSEDNEEDCLGNGFPACGCCLWSQGFIQCP